MKEHDELEKSIKDSLSSKAVIISAKILFQIERPSINYKFGEKIMNNKIANNVSIMFCNQLMTKVWFTLGMRSFQAIVWTRCNAKEMRDFCKLTNLLLEQ